MCSRECPVMIPPQLFAATLQQLIDDVISLQAGGLLVLGPPGGEVGPILLGDISSELGSLRLLRSGGGGSASVRVPGLSGLRRVPRETRLPHTTLNLINLI